MIAKEDGHLIILGCGDVGKYVVQTLQQSGLKFIAVDSNPKAFDNANYEYLVGNATDEDVLKQAGIETASTIIVALNADTEVIFATLMARGLNPKSTILARANSYRSIDKIYKAGADYVAALSIVAGQMLAKMTSRCLTMSCKKMDEDIALYEGIDIEKHTVTHESDLIERTVAEIGLRERFGCTLIGIEREGKIITEILPSSLILKNDVIAVIGTKQEIGLFKEKYVK
ncbi:NAD-binding protein [Methanolobus sp.]|uniref:potassium channel family protein n=1 Tax=Methanolobus sp. TaxID=1874737 RepID=UPI0025F34AD1|nr:NAD-binding protein [Methanolobus sp.]